MNRPRVAIPRLTAPAATTGILVLLALALGQWLHAYLPASTDGSRPFRVPVEVGATATMRSGDLAVTSVDGATSIAPADGEGMISPGLFVVVGFTFTPRAEKSGISYAALHDNEDRTLPIFGVSGRGSINCAGGLVDRPSTCRAVIEADPASLTGARLELAPLGSDERFDSMAVVDLGITDADVEHWRKRTTPLELPVVNELARTEVP